MLVYNLCLKAHASLAQLDRVTGYEPVGRGFESLSARHKSKQAPIFGCLLTFSAERDSNRANSKQSGGLFAARREDETFPTNVNTTNEMKRFTRWSELSARKGTRKAEKRKRYGVTVFPP